MRSVLIKDTTRAQREEIVRRALCDGGCQGCGGCGNLGGGRAEAGQRKCTAPISRESGNCGKSTSPIGRISFADRNNMLVKKPLSYTIYVTCAKLTCFCRK